MRLAFFYTLSVLVMFVGYMIVSVVVGCIKETKEESVSVVEKGIADAKEKDQKKEKENPAIPQVDEEEVKKTEMKYVFGKVEMIYFRDERVKLCFGKETYSGSVFWVPCSKRLDKYIDDKSR